MVVNSLHQIQITKAVIKLCSCEYIKHRLYGNRKNALTNLRIYRKQQVKLRLLLNKREENE